jgi:release factor glutamine methyltransferase
MKISEAYSKAVELLKQGGIEAPEFEADCLIEKAFGIDKTKRLVHPEAEVDYNSVYSLAQTRIGGTPLQYILGKWDFYGYAYSVGAGVLVPRPETEQLVSMALELNGGDGCPVIYDLCAGSGCIGLTLARELPDSKVYLFEKSDRALDYLNKNADGINNACVLKADIFNFDFSALPVPDIIVSNPPYVESSQIPSLQREVLAEPKTALDGGEDGLDFYRVIASRWLTALSEKGFAAVECGENQADEIKKMFKPVFNKTYAVTDFNGKKRIVIGEK